MLKKALVAAIACCVTTVASWGAVGDPQVMTDHPWYPGELSCSTFERLFETQKKLYKRVTGKDVKTDEDKVIASWYWRNLNYTHFCDGRPDQFNAGFAKADVNRDYWLGLFAHGGGLCFTTHAQYVGEIQYLLGPNRGRTVGVPGHTSFEVFLKGGAYGKGKWVLLDHDCSTIIFHEDGSRLLSIDEISKSLGKYKNPRFKPARQRGWLVGGLHHSDPGVYKRVKWVGISAGYAGAPPMVSLRAGETLRRYPRPGLEDGKTFVYWGMNYNTKGIPGPTRDRTWVNQPQKMYKAKKNTPLIPGQARYGNAVYTYKPDFKSDAYKEGVIEEADDHVTFEFYTPYVIAATPADPKGKWAVYNPGARNGLILNGSMTCPVKVSTDQGKNWQEAGAAKDGMDLTDLVKGHSQYFIRFEAPAKKLADTGLMMKTICQMSSSMAPRLKDGENKISFEATGRAVVRVGPCLDQAQARVVSGSPTGNKCTLKIGTPRGEKAIAVHAACWQVSSSPPKPAKYNIALSTDEGKTWKPIVKDRPIELLGGKSKDYWSQSMTFGDASFEGTTKPIQVRFSNNGGRKYRKLEAYLVYEVAKHGPVEVTFAWKEGGELKKESHTYSCPPGQRDDTWVIKAGTGVKTAWVEYAAK